MPTTTCRRCDDETLPTECPCSSAPTHTHLPKVTTDHRRNINIFTMCWKRTSDKIKHRTSTNNGSHVKKLYFALDSALTSRANPTMPTTRPLGTRKMCFAGKDHLDCLLPTTRFICCRTAMFKHHPIKSPFGKQSLLPGFRRGFISLTSCIAAAHAMHVVTGFLAHPRVFLVKF